MTDILLRHDSHNIATLTLNRPAARNALSLALMEAFDAQLTAIAEDPTIKVVILAANGPVFCSGHDLKELRATPTRQTYEATFALCSRLMQHIVALPQPVIAQVQGTATAAGCQLVATADLAIAADTAHFATPGVNIGLFCSTPMVALTRAVSRKAAMQMLLTGDAITAQKAEQLGLINQSVPAHDLATTTRALAEKIASKSPLTVAIGKKAFYRQAEQDLAEAYAYTSEVMTQNMLAQDASEGIDAFLAKRQPHWTGT